MMMKMRGFGLRVCQREEGLLSDLQTLLKKHTEALRGRVPGGLTGEMEDEQ